MLILSQLLELLFPPRCLGCAVLLAKSTGLCRDCLALVQVGSAFVCSICRSRSPLPRPLCHPKSPLTLAAVCRYDRLIAQVIQKFKYKGARHLLPVCQKLMERYLISLGYDFSQYLIVPVPLHPSRLRQRGFNQSLLLAETLAQLLSLPLCQGLVRIRPTRFQAQLHNRAERAANVAGVFGISDPRLVSGKYILLVDDVCTSGATLLEASGALKAAGAKRVIAFTLSYTA